MLNIKREFNYSICYFDSTYEDSVILSNYGKDFGHGKIKDIFGISLGWGGVQIFFLPKTENVQDFWSPIANYDLNQQAEDIYKEILFLESYIVIPCNEWAGQVKIIEPDIKNSLIQPKKEMIFKSKSFIFFISEQEYEIYKQEVKEIQELNTLEEEKEYLIISHTRTEDLEKRMKIPVFIKEKIIPCFDKHDLHSIERIKDENDNIVFGGF
ncbi:glutamate synthase (NADH) large subunit [Chryseobacterium sp. StRB126]|uniref:hypothetical protein n=1 Tax=Chryseobacterium sp. StRB126 TaxID=878220 RepID=UPI0004E987CE|nr:hypothetical protein [Chryseobacterium sp. StRB126]BAP32496.1 glutamate synthase (NADH) large subunit [Chryseobacterium sp. StRB126]